MKKSAKVQLYIGVGSGMMEFFTCKPQSKERTVDVSPAVMEYGLAKKIAA
jgi:hypothetical protein